MTTVKSTPGVSSYTDSVYPAGVGHTYVPFEPVDPQRDRYFKYFEKMCGQLDLHTMLVRRWHSEEMVLVFPQTPPQNADA